MELNEITREIVDSAIQVHRTLGGGLLESAYRRALAHELRLRGLQVQEEISQPLVYRDLRLPNAFRVDLLVEGAVPIELKSVDRLLPVHFRQLTTYLRSGDWRVGFLLNFGAARMVDGLHRVANRA